MKTNGTYKFFEENTSREKFISSSNPFQDGRMLKKDEKLHIICTLGAFQCAPTHGKSTHAFFYNPGTASCTPVHAHMDPSAFLLVNCTFSLFYNLDRRKKQVLVS